MFSLTKANNFSEEEIRNIFKNSVTITEVLIKLGYSKNTAENYTSKGRQLAQELNIDISHLPSSKNTNFFKVGERIGRLTIVSEKIRKNKYFYYNCKCDCGNEKLIRVDHLKKKETLSCGCIHKEKMNHLNTKDLTGQVFGRLTVLERDFSRKGSNAFWKCRCECGNLTSARGSDLYSGHKYSCGCVISKGENKIENILKQLNVSFQTQYSFDSLRSKKGYPLRFDFAIFKKEKLIALIEYQGIQHYQKVSYFEKHDFFKERRDRDQLKKDFAIKNKIPLIIIPYWDYNKITEEYLEEKLWKLL